MVGSRFVPRFNIPITEYKVASPFPNGFVIQQLNSSQVNVLIDGNVHVSQNLIVDGGIDPIYLQLRPMNTTTPPFEQTGTLWIKEDNSQKTPIYSLMMDNHEVFHTSPIKNGNYANLAVNVVYSPNNEIQVSSNIVPSLNGYDGTTGYNLGSESSFWNKLFVRDLIISPNTIRVVGEDNTEMRICYDTKTGKSIVKTAEYEVETVTTSKLIPGQIDASFLPFSGLTFASKINVETYVANVSNTLLDQLLHTIYTLDKEVVDAPVHNPGQLVECDTAKLIKNITGHYYIVITSSGKKVPIALPKVIASTNLTSDSDSTILVTSPFTLLSQETVEVSDGDILIFYHSYVPNPQQIGTFNIIFGFQNINFRLPINSIANVNILNNTITSNKLEHQTITNEKMSSGSINVRTLSKEVLELIATSSGNNAGISTAIGELQTTVNRLEKYVTLMSCTYFITDTTTGENVTYDTIDNVVL